MTMKELKIEPGKTAKKLTDFISKTVSSKGFEKVVLGLSGGLDSSVVAYLAKRALGRGNLIGVIMPYGRLSHKSVQDARRIAKRLKIKTEYVDISHMIDTYFAKIKDAGNIRRGNKMARERMSILYDLSKRHDALVIGTSNRTEILLGYGTLHGDCACALNPVAGLYKSQLKALASYLGVDASIVKKAPRANLWPGQTDEDELGCRYEDVDRLLFCMVDKRMSDKALLKRGFDKAFVLRIRKKIRGNRFKTEPAMAAKV